tara:strand:+ start:639 stop:1256 length:618 start_codon:yes stop_codon:yes gene_type:complete
VEIPEINIPEISIPNIHIPYTFLPNYEHSNIEVIGCKYYHRDTKNTGNRNLLIDDPRGVVSDCPFPSFIPLQYVPDQLIIVEEAAPENKEPDKLPEGKPPQAQIPKEEKKEDDYKPCPDKNDRRIGEYTSEARTERIKSYKRGSDGECITEYESVTFVDSFLPSPSAALNVATISLIAATSPLILNAIKPLVKNLIKKLTKKKEK